jgi:hypothetical protein
MESNPTATFSSAMLRDRSSREFDNLVEQGFLVSASSEPEFAVDDVGRRRRVEYRDDHALLIDDDDPDEEPVMVPRWEVRQWRVDVAAVADVLRDEYGLDGSTGRLSERLWLIGTSGSKSYVLAFLSPETAERQIGIVASLVPGGPMELFLVCPSYQPDPRSRRHLEDRCVFILALDDAMHLQPAPQRPAGDDDEEPRLRHSNDFRKLQLGARSWALSPPQAAVVRALYHAAQTGFPEVAWNDLKNAAVAAGGHPTRMNDLFGRTPNIEELIVTVRPGVYRLTVAHSEA